MKSYDKLACFVLIIIEMTTEIEVILERERKLLLKCAIRLCVLNNILPSFRNFEFVSSVKIDENFFLKLSRAIYAFLTNLFEQT